MEDRIKELLDLINDRIYCNEAYIKLQKENNSEEENKILVSVACGNLSAYSFVKDFLLNKCPTCGK